MVVDHDPAPDLDAGRTRQRGVGADADRDHDGVGSNGGAVVQLDPLDLAIAGDARGLRLQAHGDAPGLDRALEHERGALIELALHQPVHEMEEGDAGTGLGQAVGRFEAEQPAADHHHPSARGLGRGDGVHVVDVTEGEHARQIHPGNVRLDRLRAGGEYELGERQPGAARKRHVTRGRVDRGRTHAVAQGHAAIAPPARRPELDVVEADLVGQERGQQHAVVGEPGFLADDGDGIAAERAPRELVNETRRGHAVADHDEGLAHRVGSSCSRTARRCARPPRARAKGRRLNGFAIVVDGAVAPSTSRSVPPGLRRFIAATAGG